jgi:glycosyltransferase involved in cell wall biosynthesis
VLGAAHRIMAALVGRAAARVFVTIPAWGRLLRRLKVGAPIACLPVPSNIPTVVDPVATARLRRMLAPEAGAVIVGHFGTFGAGVGPLVAQVLPPLIRSRPQWIGLLVGRGSREFGVRLVKVYPELASRLRFCGGLPELELALHVAACDVLVQPYPDGVSGRRATIMAAMGLGVPTATNEGPLTEPFWRESGAVALVQTEELGRAVEGLVDDAERRRTLGARGQALYEARFSLSRMIAALRSASAPSASKRVRTNGRS